MRSWSPTKVPASSMVAYRSRWSPIGMTICDNMTICRNRVLPNASVDGSPAKKGCGRRRRRQIGKILNPWFGAHSGDIFLGKTEKFSRATFFGDISLRKTEKIPARRFSAIFLFVKSKKFLSQKGICPLQAEKARGKIMFLPPSP